MPPYGEAPKGPNLIAQIEAQSKCRYDFMLYPELWKNPEIAAFYQHRQWDFRKFEQNPEPPIPDESGIYMFIVAPRCGGISDHSYIFYVGKATSLRSRYQNYLLEQKGEGVNPRTKVVRFLDHLKDFVFFYYTPVTADQLTEAENLLKDNIAPTANTQLTILGRLEA